MADDVKFIWEEEVNGAITLTEFRKRVKSKKKQMGGLADDWAAARMVAMEL